MMRPMCALSQGNASVSMIAASFAVVAGGYWHHAAFHVAAIAGWDSDDDDDDDDADDDADAIAIAARCRS